MTTIHDKSAKIQDRRTPPLRLQRMSAPIPSGSPRCRLRQSGFPPGFGSSPPAREGPTPGSRLASSSDSFHRSGVGSGDRRLWQGLGARSAFPAFAGTSEPWPRRRWSAAAPIGTAPTPFPKCGSSSLRASALAVDSGCCLSPWHGAGQTPATLLSITPLRRTGPRRATPPSATVAATCSRWWVPRKQATRMQRSTG